MCSGQPVSSANSSAREIASSSATTGRECGPVARARPARARGQRVVLGVHGDDPVQSRRGRHSGVQRRVVGAAEVLDARVRHEGLEADHAALGELLHVPDAPRHQTAPEAEVDARGRLRSGQLGVEGLRVGRRRRRVERHVEVGREAAGGERRAAGRDPLPVRPARLVEVHVWVEPAREDQLPARVDLAPGALQLGLDRGDHAVDHADVRVVAPDDQVIHRRPR